MSEFRKKPVVIDAVQYHDWMRSSDALPDGVVICPWPDGDHPTIHTLEGDHRVSDGDWIITGIKGEKYPCKPDIFAATYVPVADAAGSSGAARLNAGVEKATVNASVDSGAAPRDERARETHIPLEEHDVRDIEDAARELYCRGAEPGWLYGWMICLCQEWRELRAARAAAGGANG